MRPVVRVASVPVNIPSVSRVMSTLVPGAVLAGRKYKYRLVKVLGEGKHQSIVFKAAVLPGPEVDNRPKWAVVKAARPGNKDSRQDLKRELEVYSKPSVNSSSCFRAVYDIVGNPKDFDNNNGKTTLILVLEWVDIPLSSLPYEDAMYSYTIIKAVVETVLRACDALHKENLVDTDIKPDNIMISNVHSGHPVVKLGDLGLVHKDGSRIEVQPYAMRAPEVYEGKPCTASSAVWAVAATLLCWMKPGVLGLADNKVAEFREGWCIAKIRRLIPSWTTSPVEDDVIKAQLDLGEAFIKTREPDIEKISSLKDEMKTIEMLPELGDLLLRMFVPDPKARPSPTELLASKEYLALEEKARASLGVEN